MIRLVAGAGGGLGPRLQGGVGSEGLAAAFGLRAGAARGQSSSVAGGGRRLRALLALRRSFQLRNAADLVAAVVPGVCCCCDGGRTNGRIWFKSVTNGS